MQSWAGKWEAVLRQQYPHLDVWYVPRVVPKGYTWHARPKGHPVATINADSPEHLIAEIREQETAQ